MLTKYKTWIVIAVVAASAYVVGGFDLVALCAIFAGTYWWLSHE